MIIYYNFKSQSCLSFDDYKEVSNQYTYTVVFANGAKIHHRFSARNSQFFKYSMSRLSIPAEIQHTFRTCLSKALMLLGKRLSILDTDMTNKQIKVMSRIHVSGENKGR